jgi:hypothetical protein
VGPARCQHDVARRGQPLEASIAVDLHRPCPHAARLSGLDRTRPACGQDDVNGPEAERVASKVSMKGRCCASLVQSCYRGWSMDEAMIPGL